MSEQSEQLMLRTKSFAHACVSLAMNLPKNNLGWHLQKQIIRSATSVAANYRSACLAQSKASFIAKISICLEECDESYFWLEFMRDENLLINEETNTLIKEAQELRAIFYASRNTTRKKLKN